MTVRTVSHWALFAIGTILAVLRPDDAPSDATGPDYYLVVDVAADETLPMRVGPSTEFPIVAEIPHDADGVANLGCTGGLTFEQWSRASDEERLAARNNRWCLVGYARAVGWVPGRLVAEGQPPDRFLAGAPLGALRGSEWRLVRIGAEPVESEATIAFASDGRVNGKAGCNRFTGGYTQGPQSLAIGPLATGRMACPEPVMTFERAFLNALEKSATYVARHLVLVLLDDRLAVVAEFARADWD